MFIYVFSEQDKAKLLADGFILMKEDTRANIYIFAIDIAVKDDSVRLANLSLDNYCITDVLTF